MASWTKLAGRKIVVSIWRSGRPGRISSMAFSTSLVTSSVLPHGSFSTTSMRPGPSLMTASPASSGASWTTLATSPIRNVLPSRSASATWARSSGVTIGSSWRTPRRWFGVSMKPPVPMKPPSANFRIPASRAVGRHLHHLVERHASRPRASPARPRTWYALMRSPQMATLATPRHPQQPGADLPVGRHRHVLERHGVRGQADLHDPARRRQRLQHDRRRRPGGQGVLHRGHPLLDELAVVHLVRAELEDQLDVRELRGRLRAHDVEPVETGERLLHRDRDERLHLGRRQPEAGDLDLDPWWRELGEDVDRHLPQRADAEQHHARRPRPPRGSGTSGSS